jgi:hypothetical protein
MEFSATQPSNHQNKIGKKKLGMLFNKRNSVSISRFSEKQNTPAAFLMFSIIHPSNVEGQSGSDNSIALQDSGEARVVCTVLTT